VVNGLYPKVFEFYGKFFNGKRDEWGIMTFSNNLKYYGYFINNMMDGIFIIINSDED